jgi:hypothetical protein
VSLQSALIVTPLLVLLTPVTVIRPLATMNSRSLQRRMASCPTKRRPSSSDAIHRGDTEAFLAFFPEDGVVWVLA